MLPRTSAMSSLTASAFARHIVRPKAAKPMCFSCLPAHPPPRPHSRALRAGKALTLQRWESTTKIATETATSTKPGNSRQEVEDALLDLQKNAPDHVNLSRLQLALNGLRQAPGKECVRIAVLGLNDRTAADGAGQTAKQVLKLLLADPLKNEEEWERKLDEHGPLLPLVIRVGRHETWQTTGISLMREKEFQEINVPSATFGGHGLELLYMPSSLRDLPPEMGEVKNMEDSVLVPTHESLAGSEASHTHIMTPVHKALLVGEGLPGAARLASLPLAETNNVVAGTANIRGYRPPEDQPLSFTLVDVVAAQKALDIFRKDIGNSVEYQETWYQSNMPTLIDWFKSDILNHEDSTTKVPVRRLITSLLQNASHYIEHQRSQIVSLSSANRSRAGSYQQLKTALADWAENAHMELQEKLDLAFAGNGWRKLKWWKLFWRVDDVGMFTSAILSQKFLHHAERNVIFLAGQIEEAGAIMGFRPSYPNLPSLPPPTSQPTTPYLESTSTDNTSLLRGSPANRWPMSIPATRNHLQSESIPGLQALAQKLVLQTLSTSGLTICLGAFAYFGTLTTGIYEAGAVAALGIVWSMRRMQTRWEAARDYWEGEVREEGRKAVRGVEVAVENALESKRRIEDNAGKEKMAALERAEGAVKRATEALGNLR